MNPEKQFIWHFCFVYKIREIEQTTHAETISHFWRKEEL